MNPPRQLPLQWPHRASFGRQDFLAAPENAKALQLIDAWPQWPARCVVLVGPPGAGKSHLAALWKDASGAQPPEAMAPNTVAEDCDRALDERALFHAINRARQDEGYVLMTARTFPGSWAVAIADLASRLKAAPVVEIATPGDALLRTVLAKLFADRQLTVDEATLSYLLTRMPRSLDAARALVEEIDRTALAERAEVTRAFVAKVMARFAAPEFFGEQT